MTSFARKVLDELPAPNLPGVINNNFRKLVPARGYNDKFNIKLDSSAARACANFTASPDCPKTAQSPAV